MSKTIQYSMDDEGKKVVREFNQFLYTTLKSIIDTGMNTKMIKNPLFFRVFYDGKKFNVSKPTKRGFYSQYINNFSEEYIDYFWAEFDMGEGQDEKKYRISMFFKGLDRKTGNIQVLPGNIQFWEKANVSLEPTADFFSVYNGYTSDVNRKDVIPYKGHDGGQIYCEEGWIPCAYEVKEQNQKLTREFYMQMDANEQGDLIEQAKERGQAIGRHVFECKNVEKIREIFKDCEGLKSICSKVEDDKCENGSEQICSKPGDESKLINRVYEKIGTENLKGGGQGAYKHLKWKKNTGEDKKVESINLFYKTLYLENYGYFVAYGNNIQQCIAYLEKKQSSLYKEIVNSEDATKYKNIYAGPNYVIEKDDNTYYWKLLYSNECNSETKVMDDNECESGS